jgi:DNA-binding NarL/FixJ family response regulator
LVQKSYPLVKVICLSPFINETLVADFLERGAQGILSKNADLSTLSMAIDTVSKNKTIVENRAIRNTDKQSKVDFSERQMHFLHLCASDMSYKEIAAEMQLSYKTIDNYRDELFRKLNTRSRTGLALYAIRYGLATC